MVNRSAHLVIINTLPMNRPWHWLYLGWKDFKQATVPSVLHGFVISVFGLLMLVLAYDHFWLLAGAFSGFLLVAPVIAVGLYAISDAIEQGKPATVKLVTRTWLSWRGQPNNDWRLVQFGLLLALSGTGWVLTSAALITVFPHEPVNQPLDFLRVVVLAPEDYLFELWLIVGGVLAAPVFASTVVTIPLLLDRKIGILDAVLVSWRVIIENPYTLALWAAILLLLTMLAILTVFGCTFVIPILGHASWHAYRDSVNALSLPPRVQE